MKVSLPCGIDVQEDEVSRESGIISNEVGEDEALVYGLEQGTVSLLALPGSIQGLLELVELLLKRSRRRLSVEGGWALRFIAR